MFYRILPKHLSAAAAAAIDTHVQQELIRVLPDALVDVCVTEDWFGVPSIRARFETSSDDYPARVEHILLMTARSTASSFQHDPALQRLVLRVDVADDPVAVSDLWIASADIVLWATTQIDATELVRRTQSYW